MSQLLGVYPGTYFHNFHLRCVKHQSLLPCRPLYGSGVKPTPVWTSPIHKPLSTVLPWNAPFSFPNMHKRRSCMLIHHSTGSYFGSLRRCLRSSGYVTGPYCWILCSPARSSLADLIVPDVTHRYEYMKFPRYIAICTVSLHFLQQHHQKGIPLRQSFPTMVSSHTLELSIVQRELVGFFLNFPHLPFHGCYLVGVPSTCF